MITRQLASEGQARSAGTHSLDKTPGAVSGTRPAAAKTKLPAAMVAVGPAVLLAGLIYHPYIATPADREAVAAALSAGHTRWAISHLVVGIGSGLLALAFLAIHSYLREAGEQFPSALALPSIVIGSVLFAMLPGIEIGILAGAEAGADVAAAQSAVDRWFIPILVSGSVLFLLGSVGFARAIVRSGAFPARMASFVAAALIVAAVSRFVPLGVSLYVGGAALVLALWPVAVVMSKHSRPA